jgi:hypothetical protein
MAFVLFIGLGLGSLVFQGLLVMGFPTALTIFGMAALVAAGIGLRLFREEQASVPVE